MLHPALMMKMAAIIERARPSHLPSVLRLLEREGLLLDGARELGEAMVLALEDDRASSDGHLRGHSSH